jgi:hypothetical protein
LVRKGVLQKLKALFIHDPEGKTLREVKEMAEKQAVNLWRNTERSLLRVRQVSYLEDLEGWIVVVEHIGG